MAHIYSPHIIALLFSNSLPPPLSTSMHQTSASSARYETSNSSSGPHEGSKSHQFGNVIDDFPAVQSRTLRSPWNTYATSPGGGNWPVGQSSSILSLRATSSLQIGIIRHRILDILLIRLHNAAHRFLLRRGIRLPT
jgi:hypothetical protein